MACIVEGRFSIQQRATWPIKVWQQAPQWAPSHSSAWWSLRYLGRHSYWHSGSLSPEYVIRLCSLSAWSGGQTQKKRNILKLHPIIISFPSPLRRSVLLTRLVRTSFLHLVIESLLTLTTHERHFSFFNAFTLRSSALMLSVSPIRSAILRWKCDVTNRDTPSSCLFHS